MQASPSLPDTMQPLSHWPVEQRRDIIGVFTNIDDTLTTAGAITTDALQALRSLKDAGLQVIAITGRPAGWSEPLARSWPVDAIVAENGAVALVNHPQSTPPTNQRDALSRLYQQDAETRATNFARMQQVTRRVLHEVSGAVLSQDSPGRETDIAIDHSEFTQLSSEKIAKAVQIMQAEGMSASVSSIHINGWYGGHNKLTGAIWIVRALYGRALDAEMHRWAFVGDSTNDAVMFEAFGNSVGVANIRRFESELAHRPRYITQHERGAGFAEVAQALLSARPGLATRVQRQTYDRDRLCFTKERHMNFSLECEREDDGRWLAEVSQLPGVLAYGASANEAMAKAKVLALRVLAERLEHGETRPLNITISIPAVA